MSDWRQLLPVEDFYIFTDPATRQHRQQVCNSCEHQQGVKCNQCGCFLMFLRKIHTATCPLSKWDTTVITSNTYTA